MRKRVVQILVLVLISLHLHSQFVVSGKVVNVNDDPIIGATVISDIGESTVSDLNGFYTIQNVSEGPMKITVSSVGFRSLNLELNIKADQEVQITLEESITNLPEVLVQSVTMTGGLAHVHKNIGSAHFIGQKEIQRFSYTDINRTL